MATIGILHAGLHGHVVPANRLAALLVRRGHHVIAWSSERFRGLVEAAGCEHRRPPWPYDDPRPGPGPPAVIDGPPGRPSSPFWELVAGRSQRGLLQAGRVIDEVHAADLDVLVHDYMLVAGRIAGERLGLPRVCSRGFYLQCADGPFPPTEPPRPATAAALEAVTAAAAQHWGLDLGGPMDLERNAGDVNLFYSTPEISGFAAPDPSWRLVGPLLDAEVGHEPALDPEDGRPLVYVSFGSMFDAGGEALRAAIEALAGEDVRVLAGGGGLVRPEALAPLPQNATVVGYANSRAVLAQAEVFVTHGGTASVHEALAAGVPMVCLPLGADHWQWSCRVVDLGAGELLPSLSSDEICTAVARVSEDPVVRGRTAELAAHLRDHGGEQSAVDAIEGLL